MHHMTSSFNQSTSFDDNTTIYDHQNDITTTHAITTAEFSINNILSTPFSNDSCEPDCYILFKPQDVDRSFKTKFICSVLVIAFVIIISIVVISRRFQHSKKQQKKGNECLENDKLYAHPFEEIVVVVDDPQSVELIENRPTTPPN